GQKRGGGVARLMPPRVYLRRWRTTPSRRPVDRGRFAQPRGPHEGASRRPRGGFVGARGARAVRPGGAWALVLRLDGGWTRLLPEAGRRRRVCGGVDVGARRGDGPALLCTRSVR